MAFLTNEGGAIDTAIFDDFTQSNGTSLDSYGKWSISGTGTAEVQSNQASLSTSDATTGITVTSTGADGETSFSFTGTMTVGSGATTGNEGSITITVEGVGSISVDGIVAGPSGSETYPTMRWVFAAVKREDDTWHLYLYGARTDGTTNVPHGRIASTTAGGTPTGEVSVQLVRGNGSDSTATFDTVVIG